MAENLKEVIAKMKANQKNSQQSKEAVKPIKQDVPAPAKDDFEEEMTEMPIEQEKPLVKPKEQEKQAENREQEEINAKAREIMLLQDNGIFRSELLNKLQKQSDELSEINKALVVIAGILVDQNGKR